MPKPVEEILAEAARLLYANGWRRDRVLGNGEYTITDAITVVIHGSAVDTLEDDELEAFRAARRHCLDAIGRGDTLLTEWNDEPGRTEREAMAVLRHAATLAQVDRLRAEAEQRIAPQVAEVRDGLVAVVQRQEDLLAEMRRQMAPLERHADAWSRLLRKCADADRGQAQKAGLPGAVGSLLTTEIKACLHRSESEVASRG